MKEDLKTPVTVCGWSIIKIHKYWGSRWWWLLWSLPTLRCLSLMWESWWCCSGNKWLIFIQIHLPNHITIADSLSDLQIIREDAALPIVTESGSISTMMLKPYMGSFITSVSCGTDMARVLCLLTLSCTRFQLNPLRDDPMGGDMLYFLNVNWSFYFSDDGYYRVASLTFPHKFCCTKTTWAQ